ncbi:hypothetical protein FISHEDRAFT_67520 [Fistulina hepatica ATCC 64428]|uniref:guanosine-diphosphatase n=1 Tax=Fistulina hepatica ATCC 64428 TaxID=1128425 RepID=A0A0D7A219_9AGAR|nr:hypothetical protein FISHEDRAFT_67520 [Fistulina hepatica ATCC 64428]
MPPPRGSYERLETGMGNTKSTGASTIRRMSAWKKWGIGACLVIGLVWFFGPTQPTAYVGWTPSSDVYGESQPSAVFTISQPFEDEAIGVPTDVHPTSYETDSNPEKTTHCTTTTAEKIVQWTLMIDAGSTGSRIHIYKFNNCNPSSGPAYEYEVFKMTQPGLSSFAGDPKAAAQSLDVLLDEAVRVVPENLHSCTPVSVKATAGLRLLPGVQSTDILDAVRTRLVRSYPFPIHDHPDGIVIMDGKDEGVYAWITANYLLNTIRPDTPKDTPTYAVLDLGGASTQIVFEPKFVGDDKMQEGDHKYQLTFAGRKHELYQHSYLGYGLMRARRHVHQLVEFTDSLRGKQGGSVFGEKDRIISNPCISQGMSRIVEIEDELSGTVRSVTMSGADVGSFDACNRVVQLVMAKDSICELKPCSFNGVYQPSLLDAFNGGKVLLLSYFYDRVQPLLQSKKPGDLTVSTIRTLATTVCNGRPAWMEEWGTDKELLKELDDRPEWCLDLTFMHSLLTLGYEFNNDREVELGKRIQGTELGWCLGAALGVVSSGLMECRQTA